jgi:hypothetical protein
MVEIAEDTGPKGFVDIVVGPVHGQTVGAAGMALRVRRQGTISGVALRQMRSICPLASALRELSKMMKAVFASKGAVPSSSSIVHGTLKATTQMTVFSASPGHLAMSFSPALQS